MFCPNCGTGLDNYAPASPAEPVEITLARIQADRDVAVAKLEASARRAELTTAETIAETEAEAQVDTAEAVAEIMTLAAEDAPEPVAEPEPEPDPLVIVQENNDDIAEEITPPEVEHEPTETRRRGLGMWLCGTGSTSNSGGRCGPTCSPPQ